MHTITTHLDYAWSAGVFGLIWLSYAVERASQSRRELRERSYRRR